MAGWTTNRSNGGRSRAGRVDATGDGDAVLRGPPGDPPDALDTEPGGLCPTDELIHGRSPHGAPRLVSVNTSQDVQLARVIELEIIPRLMLMHSAHAVAAPPPPKRVRMTEQHVETLVKLSVGADGASASSYVRGLIDAGADLEDVFLDLLAPCARRLGTLWEDDAYDFTQVTIGLWRLQELLYEQSSRLVEPVLPQVDGQRALLAAVPGTQHTFGVTMVAELFSRAGWDVHCENRCRWADLESQLSREWFDLFGLSVSSTESIPLVASAILKLRQASSNPKLLVMVGGPMAAIHVDLAQQCGADAMAAETAIGVELATRWVVTSRLQA